MFLIKVTGIGMIVLAFSLYGFFKAYKQKEYIKRLEKIVSATENADNMLRLGAGSREIVLTQSFEGIDGFSFVNGDASFAEGSLSDELKEKFKRFAKDFGSADITAERQRIKQMEYAVKANLQNEKKRYAQLYKIWQTAGVCTGLILGIMLV